MLKTKSIELKDEADTTSSIETKPKRATTKKVNNDYQSKGVLLSREVSAIYEPVKITYDGLLSQSGATELFAHAGIGPTWENVQDVKMTKTKTGGFEATVLASETSTLSMCFHDTANNWDNNSNENYVFHVTK